MLDNFTCYGRAVIGHTGKSGGWCGSECQCDREVQVQSSTAALLTERTGSLSHSTHREDHQLPRRPGFPSVTAYRWWVAGWPLPPSSALRPSPIPACGRPDQDSTGQHSCHPQSDHTYETIGVSACMPGWGVVRKPKKVSFMQI